MLGVTLRQRAKSRLRSDFFGCIGWGGIEAEAGAGENSVKTYVVFESRGDLDLSIDITASRSPKIAEARIKIISD